MTRKSCHTADRNYCAPNDKVAALFVDIDGTLLVCERYFQEAREDFGYFMELRGFKAADAIARLQEIDRVKAEKEGFERDRFGRSLIECYQHLVKEKRRRFSKADQERDTRILRNIGTSPFFREPELFPNALPVLGRARHNFLIVAVSIGNREAQKYKIKQSGISHDHLIVTMRDDKAEFVAAAIEDLKIDPHLSAFIGNSRRSDGACLAVTNFIYLPLEPGWAYDEKDLPKDSCFEVFNVKDWREAEDKAINRLIRRRQSLMGSVAEPEECQHAEHSEPKSVETDPAKKPGCRHRRGKAK